MNDNRTLHQVRANAHFRAGATTDEIQNAKQENDATTQAIDKKTAMLRSLRQAQEAYDREVKTKDRRPKSIPPT